MATQAKKEKVMLRQGVPVAPAPAEEIAPQTPTTQTGEFPAQYEDNLGDRVLYIVWLIGAGLLLLHFLGDTILGFLF